MTDKSPTPTIANMAVLIMKRGSLSFACVVAGWIVMMAYVLLLHPAHSDSASQWYPTSMVIGLLSLGLMKKIWLFLILPLFLIVRPNSHFWSIYFIPFFLAALGLLFAATISGFNYSDQFFDLLSLPMTICSGATGFACAVVQRLVAKKIEKQNKTENLTADRL
jgi:hypothetical protein